MKKLQSAIRRWLDVPNQIEVEAAILHEHADAYELLVDTLAKMNTRARELQQTEDRIARRFRELEQAEDEMKRVAAQTTLAVSDLVVAIEAIRQEERNGIDEQGTTEGSRGHDAAESI